MSNQDPNTVLGELQTAFEGFKAHHVSRVDAIEASLDKQAKEGAALSVNGGSKPIDRKYSNTFATYFRRGDGEAELLEANKAGQRASIQNSMSVGTNSDGGFIAPAEWDRKIQQQLLDVSPMRQVAQVQQTGTGAFTTLWNNDNWGSGWVGETAGRPETTTPGFSQISFDAGEIYANPAATQRLIDDAEVNVESWLAGSVQREFARQEGSAFISGDGTNKPRGLLTYVTGGASDGEHPGGNLGEFNSTSATDIPDTDTLVDFKYELTAPYRQNATWLMNSGSAQIISKFKDADGRYIWTEALTEGAPSRLLGRPVVIDENMPDIAADAYPIAFGDFGAGYLINDRIGTRVLRDPYTNKPFVMFYTTKRVGAGVLDPFAIKLLKIAV